FSKTPHRPRPPPRVPPALTIRDGCSPTTANCGRSTGHRRRQAGLEVINQRDAPVVIQNSVFAATDFPSICATPPSAYGVIERTGRPRDLATTAFDSSCATIDAKKSAAAIIASAQITPCPTP